MLRTTLSALFALVMVGLCSPGDAFAIDGGLHRNAGKRGLLPAGLPRAHYKYRTTIVSGPPVPYDARPAIRLWRHIFLRRRKSPVSHQTRPVFPASI